MSKVRSGRRNDEPPEGRRRFTQEFKEQAVQMVLDGHSVASVWYYNVERRHSSLGYVSPEEFERQLAVQKKATGVSAEPEAPHSTVIEHSVRTRL